MSAEQDAKFIPVASKATPVTASVWPAREFIIISDVINWREELIPWKFDMEETSNDQFYILLEEWCLGTFQGSFILSSLVVPNFYCIILWSWYEDAVVKQIPIEMMTG